MKSPVAASRRYVKSRVKRYKAWRHRMHQKRPHRSFRLTSRHDRLRLAPLPGYWSVTFETLRQLKAKVFWKLLLLYVVLYALIVGATLQANYSSLSEGLSGLGDELVSGDYDSWVMVGALFGSAVTGNLSQSYSGASQVLLVLLNLTTWLAVVWILRYKMASKTVGLRDALYNCCAPFVSFVLVGSLAGLQLAPAAIGVVIYGTAAQNNFFELGAAAMLFGLLFALLVLVSLYWISATILAAVIVTLPGTYPMAAIKAAGDLVVGRRLSMILRTLWVVVMLTLIWAVVLIPGILIDQRWPSITIATWLIQLLTGASVIMTSAYVYILYRRIIDAQKPSS